MRLATAVRTALPGYPTAPPYDPPEPYPEYPFGEGAISAHPNPVYRAVRQLLHDLGLDRKRFGTPQWDPLGELLSSDRGEQLIVLKPNWVVHDIPRDPREEENLLALITHPSVIRPLLDYALIALVRRGGGRMVLGDAPIQRCQWERLLGLFGTVEMVERFACRLPAEVQFELKDFRYEVTLRDEHNVVLRREFRPEVEYVLVDLGQKSSLMPIIQDYRRFRVTNYDPRVVPQNHNPERNLYFVHRDFLAAKLVVNLPKLKCHRKAGITCALKNLVGINCRKDYLAHHRAGDAESGHGDQYERRSRLKELRNFLMERFDLFADRPTLQRLLRYLMAAIDRLVRLHDPHLNYDGSWWGNDTCWRMVHDLNKLLCYASPEGEMTDGLCRTEISLVDGVIGGEGNGPLHPTARRCGVLLAGFNPVAVDHLAAALMGLDWRKIALLREAWHPIPAELALVPEGSCRDQIEVLVDGAVRSLSWVEENLAIPFEPPPGWKGRVELERFASPAG